MYLPAILSLPFLYIAPSFRGGRGVFTGQDIPAGTTIELSCIILLSSVDRKVIHTTRLHDYYFQWDGDQAAIALGFGSIYNHSSAPNAEFELDYDFEQIRFKAVRDIRPGEEITTDYRAGDQQMKLWFEEE